MCVAVKIALSDEELTHLNKLLHSSAVSVRPAERSRIVLLAHTDMTNEGISRDAWRPGPKPKVSS